MKVKFTRDEWYPFYVEHTSCTSEEYEISEDDFVRYKDAIRTLSGIFEKLNLQYEDSVNLDIGFTETLRLVREKHERQASAG